MALSNRPSLPSSLLHRAKTKKREFVSLRINLADFSHYLFFFLSSRPPLALPRGGVEVLPEGISRTLASAPTSAEPCQEGRKFRREISIQRQRAVVEEGKRIQKLDRNQPDESQWNEKGNRRWSLAILNNSPLPDRRLESSAISCSRSGTYRIPGNYSFNGEKGITISANCFVFLIVGNQLKPRKLRAGVGGLLIHARLLFTF